MSLTAAGHTDAVNYIFNVVLAETVVAKITAAGNRASGFAGDVSVETNVLGMFAAAQAQLGSLYGLVNDAGVLDSSSRLEA